VPNPYLAKILAAQRRQEQARREFMTELREAIEAGVSPTEIAEATGIPRVTLWRWLSGRVHVPART
jgi:DNA-binding phage protein